MWKFKQPAFCQVAFALCLLLDPRAASAQGQDQSRRAKRVVFLAVRQDDESQERALEVASAIQYQVSDLGFSIDIGWVDELAADVPSQNEHAKSTIRATGALGVLWLVETAEGLQFHLLVSDDDGQWSLVRHLETENATATAETLGVIVRASLTAFLDGKSEPGHTTSVNALRSPEPAGRARMLSAATGYAVVGASGEHGPIQGVGVKAMVSLTPSVQAFAGYTAFFPVSVTHDLAEMELIHHPAELGLRIGFSWSWLELGGALSVTIDYVSSNIDPFSTAVKVNEDSGNIQISVAPELWSTLWVLERLGLFVSIGADILVNRPRYIVQLDQGEQMIYRPWPVWPRGFAGVTLSLL